MIKAAETVVLVHGLWMHGLVMRLLGARLERCGFHTVCFSYPSMRSSLSQNASELARFAAKIEAPRIHFIGHSLGGLLILQMLAEFPEIRPGRIILAGSPYNTSCVAEKLSRHRAGRYILGRSMRQWLEQEPPPGAKDYEIGVIAGAKSIGVGRLISRLATPNDGVVTVGETRIPSTAEQIVLDVTHAQMLLSAELARQACSFLRWGRFTNDRKTAGYRGLTERQAGR
ncbi:MAG TPA: alpha/beta hydrolase [Nitrosospira sp.]|nr:alpha/beta hydrolase [Nitrosospira sp.]